MINLDSLLLAFPERWHFGPDNTGNIFAPDALNSLRHQKFELITGDGGIDCSADPEFQERVRKSWLELARLGSSPFEMKETPFKEQNSAQLKEAEYLAICDKVARGGNAVLKSRFENDFSNFYRIRNVPFPDPCSSSLTAVIVRRSCFSNPPRILFRKRITHIWNRTLAPWENFC